MSEFDFALIVSGVPELTEDVANSLFEAGCDDATVSMQYGLLYLEFSRSAPTRQEGIASAIRDITSADIGVSVRLIDDCSLVTQSEIASHMNRSRKRSKK